VCVGLCFFWNGSQKINLATQRKNMAGLSGINWCERFLSASGQIQKNFDRDVHAYEGVFMRAFIGDLVVKTSITLPGGGTMDPEVWELQLGGGPGGEDVIRLNYTDNPNITPPQDFDFLFNSDESEFPAAKTSRMFYDGTTATGQGAFRAGTATTTQWDVANRGADSVALGRDGTASGDRSAVVGGINNTVDGTDSGIFAGSGNFIGDPSPSSTIVASTGSTITTNVGTSGNLVAAATTATISGGSNQCCILASNTAAFSALNQCAVIAHSGLTSFTGSLNSAVVGGEGATINTLRGAVIAGRNNNLGSGASNGAILGGDGNTVSSNAGNAVAVGGNGNTIGAFGQISDNSTVVGGTSNTVRGARNTSVAGTTNTVTNSAADAGIFAGSNCTVDDAAAAGIMGGTGNGIGITSTSNQSFIGGGQNNRCDALQSVAVGGHSNQVSGARGVCVGGGGAGAGNTVQATATNSVVAGATNLSLEQADTLGCNRLRSTEGVQHQGVVLSAASLDYSGGVIGLDVHTVVFTGAATTFTLPFPSVGVLGQEYYVKNTTGGALTLNTPGGASQDYTRLGNTGSSLTISLPSGEQARVLLTSNADNTGAWIEW
jgi:hypothetical protein